ICLYRKGQGIDGPLFIGRDSHALSGPAMASALEVLIASGVMTMPSASPLLRALLYVMIACDTAGVGVKPSAASIITVTPL
ncbi:phosphoglucomutase, alpha-D-glucose phosphate-specific, partial [Streptomyces sp. P9(2023)]|nr:phosphoglucomutase, alpha-D-glucose phosphate-specific [Streptomyces sp. P9(2023)]